MPRTTPLLGLSERWSLARHNFGSPITVIYHTAIPSGLISASELKAAVRKLCDTYPILNCCVEGKTSRHPSYTKSKSNVEELVNVVRLDSDKTLEKLVEEAVTRGSHFNVSAGPMLEVQLHQSTSNQTTSTDRLVLLIDHILCDGLGARNLFADLLNLLSGISIPPQPKGLPSRMDDTVDLTPSPAPPPPSIVNRLNTSIGAALKQVGLSTPTPTPCPPPPSPHYDSRAAEQNVDQFAIPASELSSLLSTGKHNNIPTVHPVIHTACLAALYRASAPSEPASSFYTSVPISERREDLGDPRSTGNYVTFHYSTDTLTPSTRFWDFTQSFSASLRRPETKLEARKALGQLSLIEGKSDEEGADESKWEDYLGKIAADPRGPHRLALAVSNVGRMDLPVEGKLAGKLDEVYFTQSASAVGAAIVASIMSARGGSLTVSLSSKKGSLPDGVFEAFKVELHGLLSAIARGHVTVDCTITSQIPGMPNVTKS